MANYATNIFYASTENEKDLDKVEKFLDETELEEVIWMDYEECHQKVKDGTIPHCIYEDEFQMVGEYLKGTGKW